MRTRPCIHCGVIEPNKSLFEQHLKKCKVKSDERRIKKLHRCGNILFLKAILCDVEKPKIVKAQQQQQSIPKQTP
ncbi:hypothetical protein HMPREF1544_06549 [Mucor circinelloides 1006PhL]|uniref:Uncharacterized protein n=1 Tax=Mucor circinelloides f. circinelloides (strain 1006PhL) TaxID=1220926 RepID=S2JAF9_MUCC1|nr:hypothetical protein HMPREF1544_06549 [Mucor circinelloides 1006PhL]